jgi:heme-NO-binding protein
VHGVIFASFVDYVAARHGSDVASEILADQPIFLLSESYEDERLLALINRASELTGTPVAELVHQVGVFTAQQTFARLYPAFFAVAGGTRAFLLSVETFIHELVRATIPNASPPQLRVQPLGDDGVTINYTSSRRLCALLAGLVEGTARHYGEEVQIDQADCMLRDDPACVFEIRVSPGMLAA